MEGQSPILELEEFIVLRAFGNHPSVQDLEDLQPNYEDAITFAFNDEYGCIGLKVVGLVFDAKVYIAVGFECNEHVDIAKKAFEPLELDSWDIIKAQCGGGKLEIDFVRNTVEVSESSTSLEDRCFPREAMSQLIQAVRKKTNA